MGRLLWKSWFDKSLNTHGLGKPNYIFLGDSSTLLKPRKFFKIIIYQLRNMMLYATSIWTLHLLHCFNEYMSVFLSIYLFVKFSLRLPLISLIIWKLYSLSIFCHLMYTNLSDIWRKIDTPTGLINVCWRFIFLL